MPRAYVIHVCGEEVLVREFADGKMVKEEAARGKRFSGGRAETVAVVPGRDCVMIVIEGVEGSYRLEGGG